MAELLYCPNCKQPQPCVKKGRKKTGEQVRLCKVCLKKFILHTEVQKINYIEEKLINNSQKKSGTSNHEIIINLNIPNNVKKITFTIYIDSKFNNSIIHKL